MVGHLREEKDPLTFIAAAALVRSPQARMVHIGGALDAALGAGGAAARRRPIRATAGSATWRTTPPASACGAATRW